MTGLRERVRPYVEKDALRVVGQALPADSRSDGLRPSHPDGRLPALTGRRVLIFSSLNFDASIFLISMLREFLKDRLPDYMVPAVFIMVEAMPLTADGSKVDRKKLPAPQKRRPRADEGGQAPKSRVQAAIAEIWKEVLDVDSVGLDDKFFDIGGHSLLLARVQTRLEETFNRDVAITDLFQYPTVSGLARLIQPEGEEEVFVALGRRGGPGQTFDIAVVGMAGRFPGANSVAKLWEKLCDGLESITFFSREELEEAGVPASSLDDPDYVMAQGLMEDDPGLFDASFFDFSPREAEVMDPQHRLFLEVAWEALEDAGYNPDTHEGRIGVFGGSGMNNYAVHHVFPDRELVEYLGPVQLMVNTCADFLATRVSFKLGLEGPAVSVQTACSTSLVAVHHACTSLLGGECEMALAGGVSVGVPVKTGYFYTPGGTVSPDGHCRTFDKEANGMVGSSGVGIVVLKPLDRAVADRDPIWAVIKGTAINNDGSDKIGYTAPSVNGQARAVLEAQAAAGVEPDDISCIEAHGTGTPLGDPIEIAALTKVFRAKTQRKQFCALTAVKTNLGHLDAAAGVTGLIKMALSLRHGKIPASRHFTEPNPELRLEESPFHVNRELVEWGNGRRPRYGGVSSFGIGGTNAHAVLAEAPAREPGGEPAAFRLLVLSARTDSALERRTADLLTHLKTHPDLGPASPVGSCP